MNRPRPRLHALSVLLVPVAPMALLGLLPLPAASQVPKERARRKPTAGGQALVVRIGRRQAFKPDLHTPRVSPWQP